jgi:Fic family protein
MSEDKESGPSSEALLRALLRIALEEQRERNESLTIGDQILLLQDSGVAQAHAARILGVQHNQIPSYLRNATNKKLLAKLVKKQSVANAKEKP